MELHVVSFHVAKSYLDMARAVIDLKLKASSHDSMNDAEFGLVSCTYVYSYMSITAFVSGQLFDRWNREGSNLKKGYDQYEDFEQFMRKEVPDLKSALKLLCNELKIKKHHEKSPTTWQELTKFLKDYRDYFVHPTPEDFNGVMTKIREIPRNFASNTAVSVIGHYFDELNQVRPDWLRKRSLFIPKICCTAPDFLDR